MARSPEPLVIGTVLTVFVAVWVAYGLTSHVGMVLNDDVTEAYVWGREFQLGYHQHPPFWAWLAGVWFLVFPNRDWAFVLLAVLNSAVGLVGAWRLIGRFVLGEARMAAWLLLLCTPFYTFNCFKYNANTIFLSIWPWALFCLLRTIDSRRVVDAVWFGVMIGIASLSKYYAVVLILTCLAASMVHSGAGPYWRSRRPWISMAVAAALFLPHLVWLVLNKAPPIEYVLSTARPSRMARFGDYVSIVLAEILLQAGIPMLVWLTRKPAGLDGPDLGAATAGSSDERRLTFVLVVLPTVLTIAFGFLLGIRLVGLMLVGTFPLTAVLAMALIRRADPRRLLRWTSGVVPASMVVSLLSVPLTIRAFPHPRDPSWNLPLLEAVTAANTLWHDTTGRPLVTVGGSKFYSNAAAFYSSDGPSGFLGLDYKLAPWITPERIRTGGLLALCYREDGPMDDASCRANAARFSGPGTVVKTITVAHKVLGRTRGVESLDIFVIPPRS